MFLAGDNDVGGEGNERIKPEALERFARTFGPHTDLISRSFLDVVKVCISPQIHKCTLFKLHFSVQHHFTSYFSS